jgi:hypothetical protein
MPEKATVKRARGPKRAGRAPTTQAGPFVREEIHHVREGKHGARSTKQAIAIGLSKARRAGVKLPPPPATAKAKTKRSAEYASRAAARRRSTAARSASAHKAARTKGPALRQAAARRAARTRQQRQTQTVLSPRSPEDIPRRAVIL